jgi:hypothetical protein
MAVQTTFPDNISAAIAGLRGTMIPATLISRTVETVAGIAFGVAVARGTDDNGCKVFGSGDTAILGITVIDRSVNTADKYSQYESASIMTKGPVWVMASVAVNDGDPVYVIPSTGAFAKTSASSAVLIANAVWDTTTTGAGLALVRMG